MATAFRFALGSTDFRCNHPPHQRSNCGCSRCTITEKYPQQCRREILFNIPSSSFPVHCICLRLPSQSKHALQHWGPFDIVALWRGPHYSTNDGRQDSCISPKPLKHSTESRSRQFRVFARHSTCHSQKSIHSTFWTIASETRLKRESRENNLIALGLNRRPSANQVLSRCDNQLHHTTLTTNRLIQHISLRNKANDTTKCES